MEPDSSVQLAEGQEDPLEDTPWQHRYKVLIAIILILVMIFGYLLL